MYTIIVKTVACETPQSGAIELQKTIDHKFQIEIDSSVEEIQFQQILSQLGKDMQKNLDGKMISYYNTDY